MSEDVLSMRFAAWCRAYERDHEDDDAFVEYCLWYGEMLETKRQAMGN